MVSILEFCKKEIKELLNNIKDSDELMLVGDRGVYLMSFAQEPGKRNIVYAQGCNPNKDPDYYENKRILFGGDDGADKIGNKQEWMQHMDSDKEFLKLKLTPTEIHLES